MCIRDSISTQLFDRGLLNRNGVMDVWNMAHVEGGEKYYIRKEYAEVSELGKPANKKSSPKMSLTEEKIAGGR